MDYLNAHGGREDLRIQFATELLQATHVCHAANIVHLGESPSCDSPIYTEHGFFQTSKSRMPSLLFVDRNASQC